MATTSPISGSTAFNSFVTPTSGLNLVVMMPEALYEAIEGTAVR